MVFSIEPATPNAEWSGSLFLSPAQGEPIEVADGARLLQGLTGIDPSLLQPPGAARQHWYAAALAGRLAGTPFAGYAVATPGAPDIDDEQCCLRLTLRSSRHQITSLARASVPAWIDFPSQIGCNLPGLLFERLARHEAVPLRACEPGQMFVRHSMDLVGDFADFAEMASTGERVFKPVPQPQSQ